jgi:tetrahydromethanopterin S-methyltransferase subunit B
MADARVDEHIIKVHVLESNINNLSAKVEKLCDHLDDSLPRLTELHLKLQDDFEKRKIIEKHVDHILEQVAKLNTVQVEQQKRLDIHHSTLELLREESNYNIKSLLASPSVSCLFHSNDSRRILCLR